MPTAYQRCRGHCGGGGGGNQHARRCGGTRWSAAPLWVALLLAATAAQADQRSAVCATCPDGCWDLANKECITADTIAMCANRGVHAVWCGAPAPSSAARVAGLVTALRVSDPTQMLSKDQRDHIATMLEGATRCGGCEVDAAVFLSPPLSDSSELLKAWKEWESTGLGALPTGDGASVRYILDGTRLRKIGRKTKGLMGEARMEALDAAALEAAQAVGGEQQKLYGGMKKLGQAMKVASAASCEANDAAVKPTPPAPNPPPPLPVNAAEEAPVNKAKAESPSENKKEEPAEAAPKAAPATKEKKKTAAAVAPPAGKKGSRKSYGPSYLSFKYIFGDLWSNAQVLIPLGIVLYFFRRYFASPTDDDLARMRGSYSDDMTALRASGTPKRKGKWLDLRKGKCGGPAAAAKAARVEAARRGAAGGGDEAADDSDDEPESGGWGLFDNPLLRWGGYGADSGRGGGRAARRGGAHDDDTSESGPKDPSGLMNRGNYCFMNAALQCLFATRGFIDAAKKSPVHRHGEMLSTLLSLAVAVSKGLRTSVQLEAVRGQCEAVLPPDMEGGKFVVAEGDNPLPCWKGGVLGRQRQQDAHEFLSKLMDVLDAAAKPASGRQNSPASAGALSPSPVCQLFELRKEAHGSCSICGKEWKMNAHPGLFEEVGIGAAAAEAAQQLRRERAGKGGGSGGNGGRIPPLSLQGMLKGIYKRSNVVLDCEGCEAEAKKRLEKGGSDGKDAPSTGCEIQILIPPNDDVIVAAKVASEKEETSGKSPGKKGGNLATVKTVPTRGMPTQNERTGWVQLENLIAERLQVSWAELRYVPQFGTPTLLPPRELLGGTAQDIIDFQNEQELKKRQIAATVHGDDEFQANIDQPKLDFSEGMEFLMKDRSKLSPTPMHDWGTLVAGRPNVGDQQVYSWEQWQENLAREGSLIGMEGEVAPLMVSPWVLQLKLPTVAKYETMAARPSHYAVHLNRHTGMGGLDKSPVEFEDELDLSFAAGVNEKSPWVYQLYAVTFHLGSTSNTGHYFAYVKNQRRNRWLLMDDDDVREQVEGFHPCKDVEFAPRMGTAAAVMLLYETAEER